MDLNGKIALVTGSAHRVGKAIALGLAREGCDVVVHYNRAAAAACETVAEIQRLRRRSVAVQSDLTRTPEIDALFCALDDVFGALDILVNSAAIMKPVDLLSATESDWHQTMDLNLKAAFFCTQQAARRMAARGGAIVNVADIAGLRPWKQFPIHSISKAGLQTLTQVAALALAPKIRVNAVAPGPVLKPEHMPAKRWDRLTRSLPLGRGGSPEDVARAVVFLCQNDYITGDTLVVDGGNQYL
jgi:pteridine reductase